MRYLNGLELYIETEVCLLLLLLFISQSRRHRPLILQCEGQRCTDLALYPCLKLHPQQLYLQWGSLRGAGEGEEGPGALWRQPGGGGGERERIFWAFIPLTTLVTNKDTQQPIL